MEPVAFNEALGTGIEEIDAHHNHLVNLFNAFLEAFKEGQHRAHVGPLLDELFDYATYHFTAEERWMEENGYPDIGEHRLHHVTFCGRMVEIHRDFVLGNHVTLEVLVFVKKWLVGHIADVDSDLGRFAARGNCKAA